MSTLNPVKRELYHGRPERGGGGGRDSEHQFIINRPNLRGLKICPSCDSINGQRSTLCKNEHCELRKKILASQLPFDPIRLVTHNCTEQLFSVRNKEREVNSRNFVQICTEVVLAKEPNATIVSSNAVCFVDACKYAASSTCNHVKACLNPDGTKAAKVPLAEVYSIKRDVIFNLNIDLKMKQRLWEVCAEDELVVPAVQRLNSTMFAVKCEQTKTFPAGRLHVTASNHSGKESKKSTHSCACKKLKIILQPDNSVVMQEEVCEHILLVLAAILSQANRKGSYGGFVNGLKAYWVIDGNKMLDPDPLQDDSFFSMDINIGDDLVDTSKESAPDDIFIFDDKFLATDYIPDLSDIVLESVTKDLTPLAKVDTKTAVPVTIDSMPLLLHSGDPNLVSSCDAPEIEEDIDIRFADATAALAAETKFERDASDTTEMCMESIDTQLEFSDCNIELMDQYQLTDRIDLCSSVTELQDKTCNSFSVFNPNLSAIPAATTIPTSTPGLSILTNMGPIVATEATATAAVTPATQTIELPTIAVVEKRPVKAAEIVDAIKTRKLPAMPAKRALIVNMPPTPKKLKSNQISSSDVLTDNVSGEPSLAYSAWLEHVIEIINESIRITDKTDVMHNFHVHEEIFAHLCKTFSAGAIMRMPDVKSTIKSGKYKGLSKYSWHFSNPSQVRRIFTTKNLSLQVERSFERSDDGSYVPYVRKTAEELAEMRRRRIYPKLVLYMAQMCFDRNGPDVKNGVRLEWIANVLPRSHFGALSIQFSLAVKLPNEA